MECHIYDLAGMSRGNIVLPGQVETLNLNARDWSRRLQTELAENPSIANVHTGRGFSFGYTGSGYCGGPGGGRSTVEPNCVSVQIRFTRDYGETYATLCDGRERVIAALRDELMVAAKVQVLQWEPSMRRLAEPEAASEVIEQPEEALAVNRPFNRLRQGFLKRLGLAKPAPVSTPLPETAISV